MPITVTCDECSEPHRVRDDAVGKQFVCKGCGKLLTVEASADDSQNISRVDAEESHGDAAPPAGDAEFDLHRFLTETVPADLRVQRESPPKQTLTAKIDTWIGCVLFLVVSSCLAVWLPVSFYRDHGPPVLGTNFLGWLAVSIFWAMSLGGVWLSVRLIRFVIFGVKVQQGVVPGPEYSSESLVCTASGWMDKPVRVIVDLAAMMIHFHNCHVPGKFFGVRAQVWFSCPLKKVISAHRLCYSHRGGTKTDFLRIVTPAGIADMHHTATNYGMLCVALASLTRRGPTLSTSHPALPLLSGGGAFCGIIAVFLFLPLRGSFESLLLWIVAGAIGGAVVPFVFVAVVSRFQRRN